MPRQEPDIKEFKDFLESLPKQSKDNLSKIISDYVSDIQKEDFFRNLPENDIDCLSQSISCISHISHIQLKEQKETEEFKKIYELLCASREKNRLEQELVEIYERNKNQAKEFLLQQKAIIEKFILDDQFENYQKIKDRLPEKSQ